jgi:hypothetical protein
MMIYRAYDYEFNLDESSFLGENDELQMVNSIMKGISVSW